MWTDRVSPGPRPHRPWGLSPFLGVRDFADAPWAAPAAAARARERRRAPRRGTWQTLPSGPRREAPLRSALCGAAALGRRSPDRSSAFAPRRKWETLPNPTARRGGAPR